MTMIVYVDFIFLDPILDSVSQHIKDLIYSIALYLQFCFHLTISILLAGRGGQYQYAVVQLLWSIIFYFSTSHSLYLSLYHSYSTPPLAHSSTGSNLILYTFSNSLPLDALHQVWGHCTWWLMSAASPVTRFFNRSEERRVGKECQP